MHTSVNTLRANQSSVTFLRILWQAGIKPPAFSALPPLPPEPPRSIVYIFKTGKQKTEQSSRLKVKKQNRQKRKFHFNFNLARN